MLYARDELVNSILEEEDELIAAHRKQIEDTMTIVRLEMNLLGEVRAVTISLSIWLKAGRKLSSCGWRRTSGGGEGMPAEPPSTEGPEQMGLTCLQ